MERFTDLINQEDSVIREQLIEYLQSNIKLAESVYELFGDKLAAFIPERLMADFAAMFIYDTRVLDLLIKAV